MDESTESRVRPSCSHCMKVSIHSNLGGGPRRVHLVKAIELPCRSAPVLSFCSQLPYLICDVPRGSVAVKTIRRERCRSDEVRLSPWPPPHVNNGHPEWAVSSGARVDSIGEI